MRLVEDETCPLPDDPVLASVARALNDGGHWGEVVDREWRGAFLTDEARWMFGGRVGLAPYPLGAHFFGAERVSVMTGWRGGQFPLEIVRRAVTAYGPWVLADTPGGREALRGRLDPRLQDLADELAPVEPPPACTLAFRGIYTAAGAGVDVQMSMVRLRDDAGEVVGTALLNKPAVGMSVLARLTSMWDARHFARMERVVTPGRRPAAVLFADLESSSDLARRLSTAGYFTLVRRLARAADQSVVDAGGLAGTHAGDGVVAFFLAEAAGSESAAARACITAARAMRDALPAVADRCDLRPEDVVLRFGLHWAANLYVGQIATSARTEVTALGDQVNETARIEACATGGRTLVSKDLVERLQPGDAGALDLDADRLSYTPLGTLGTATDKARRDAPAIAVCQI